MKQFHWRFKVQLPLLPGKYKVQIQMKSHLFAENNYDNVIVKKQVSIWAKNQVE